MSAGDRGNKHFMSQRHVSGECNAGFRKKKKNKKENKELDQTCGFLGTGMG